MPVWSIRAGAMTLWNRARITGLPTALRLFASRPMPPWITRSAVIASAAIASVAIASAFALTLTANAHASPTIPRSSTVEADRPSDDADWTLLWRRPSGVAYPVMSNVEEPAVNRHGDEVDVVWPVQTTASTRAYQGATIDVTGAVRIPAHVLLDGWGSLVSTPRVLSQGEDRYLVFTGSPVPRERAQSASDASVHVITSSDFLAWSAVDPSGLSGPQITSEDGSLSGFDAIWGSAGIVVAGNPRGVGALRWTASSLSATESSVPVPGAITMLGCCARHASLVRDEADGALYAAFFSTSPDDAERGLHVGRIAPTLGTFARPPMPAWTRLLGSAAAIPPDQRVAMASRPRGGLMVAYPVGFPQTESVLVWQVGEPRAVSVPGSRSAHRIAIAEGTDGITWIAWTTSSKVLTARLRDGQVIRGSTQTVAAPIGSTDLFTLSAVAGRPGELVLVLTATGPDHAIDVYARRVLATSTSS